MYYRLKDSYILRGWDKLPYAVIDTQTMTPRFLTAPQFRAVELCDGNVDVSVPFIPDSTKQLLADFEAEGIIESCSKGQGITQHQQYRKYNARYLRSVHWSIKSQENAITDAGTAHVRA